MQHLSNLAHSRIAETLRVPRQQTGFVSLDFVLIGTAVAIIALWIAFGGNVGAVPFLFSR